MNPTQGTGQLTVVDDLRPSLADLAAAANREHGLVRQSAEAMIEHAIAAGEALLAAHDACEHGAWLDWLEANFYGHIATANGYMRIAFYKHQIREAKLESYRQARAFIKGLPGPHEPSAPVYPGAVREKALELLAAGLSQRQVADQLGVGRDALRQWANPAYAEQRRERNRRRRRKQVAGDSTVRVDRAVLTASIRWVGAALRSGDPAALREALDQLVDTAARWVEQLDEEAKDAA